MLAWRSHLPPRLTAGAAGVTVAAAAEAAAATSITTAIARTTLRGTAEAATTSAVGRLASETTATTAASASTEAAAAAAEFTEIAVGIGTTTAAARSASTATSEGRLASNGLEERRKLLVGLLEKFDEVSYNTAVASVEESSGDTSVSGTASTTDTVHVVINVSRKVIVDNVSDVGNVETTGRNSSGNQDWAATVTEELESSLTLPLGSVSVDRSGWEVLVDQEVRQRVGHALCLHKDKCQATGMGMKNIKENRALVNVLNVLNALCDVLGGRANTADREEDVVFEEVPRKHLNVAWEGGRKHERLAVCDLGHVLTLNDTTNLRLETHVQHSIGLVENKVFDVAEGDAATFQKIDQATGRSHQKITSTLNLAQLGANIGTTIHDARTNPGAVGKLARLVIDLRDQLTSGSQDQGGRECLALTAKVAPCIGRKSRGTVEESLRKNGEEETTSLSGTSLSASHQITAAHDNGDRVLLDGSRDLVVGQLNVADKVVIQGRLGKLEDGLRDVAAGCLNRNVVVLLEVDTSLLLGGIIRNTKELALHTGVGRASDVLAITPLSITGAASGVVTAAATVAAALTAALTAMAVLVTTIASTTTTAPSAAAVVLLGRRVRLNIITPVVLASAVVLPVAKVSMHVPQP